MSTMRIFSKKRFAIGPGAIRGTDKIELFVTNPGTFQDMPEKYKDDATFKLAVKLVKLRLSIVLLVPLVHRWRTRRMKL